MPWVEVRVSKRGGKQGLSPEMDLTPGMGRLILTKPKG